MEEISKELAKKEIAKEIFKDLEKYNYNIGKDNDGSLCIMKNGWSKLKSKWLNQEVKDGK